MKRIMKLIVVLLPLLMFTVCTLDSPYIDGIEEKIASDKTDVTPPEQSGDSSFLMTMSKAGGGEMTLNWTEPSDPDFNGVTIVCNPGGITYTPSKGTTTQIVTGLTIGIRYTISSTINYSSKAPTVGNSLNITLPSAATDIICITTAAELDDIRNNLSGYHLLLMDIDLAGYSSGEGWIPIGSGTSFSGTLDGNNHTISNMKIYRPNDYQGFFRSLDGTVTYLRIVAASINAGSKLGLLTGDYAAGSIRYCHTQGTINGSNSIGGIAGTLNGGTIDSCSSDVTINGSNSIGGIAGYSIIPIQGCHSTVNLSSTGSNIGGIVGNLSLGSIDASYARGTLGTTGSSEVGGIAGNVNSADIKKSYAAVTIDSTGSNLGGIVGATNGIVENSLYDSTIVGVTNNSYGTGRNTTDMKSSTTFVAEGWNFTSIWDIDSSINDGYPYLRNWPPQN